MSDQRVRFIWVRALDADLVDSESIRTNLTLQDDSSIRNDDSADDGDNQIPFRRRANRLRFSPNKTSAVFEKTSPRSDLRWKPTGRIFKSVGLRWIPTESYVETLCTSKLTVNPHMSMVAEKADISETIVKVDSQMMIQKDDV
ncbi:hypothetical protein Tco_0646758 [Tanacetum coccineum]